MHRFVDNVSNKLYLFNNIFFSFCQQYIHIQQLRKLNLIGVHTVSFCQKHITPFRFNGLLLLNDIFQCSCSFFSHCLVCNFHLKGPQSATPLFLFTYENLAITCIFYLQHVETKEITFKLLKIIKHTFRNTTYRKTIRFRFTKQCK